jgi:tetratricopeptide (TPR) repeat protein
MVSSYEIWRSWRDRRAVLREMRRQEIENNEWAYFRFKDCMLAAKDALQSENYTRATQVWANAVTEYPGQALRSTLALDVLLGLRRFDDAEALMQEGLKQSPREPRFAVGLAQVAGARGDYEAAIQRWAVVRTKHPRAMPGYIFGVEALRECKRLSEAEALVEEALRRFPDEVAGFMEHAKIAEARLDWVLALQRWNVVRERFDHPSGYISAGNALVKLARYDEAEALYSA